MSYPLRVATWNIHKGFSQFNRRLTVHELRDSLRRLAPDIAFLQEVQGEHRDHSRNHAHWPAQPQHEFLAEDHWPMTAYGRNMHYDAGHHGNAILSRHPILSSHNQDITHYAFEKRGLLHCRIQLGEGPALHCVCAHLSLMAHSRRRQLDALAGFIEQQVPSDAPLIIAGDFNDWRNHAHPLLARRLGLQEAFTDLDARGRAIPVRSFPAALPMLRLDRIYLRHLRVLERRVCQGPPWSALSDHAALSVLLEAV